MLKNCVKIQYVYLLVNIFFLEYNFLLIFIGINVI